MCKPMHQKLCSIIKLQISSLLPTHEEFLIRYIYLFIMFKFSFAMLLLLLCKFTVLYSFLLYNFGIQLSHSISLK